MKYIGFPRPSYPLAAIKKRAMKVPLIFMFLFLYCSSSIGQIQRFHEMSDQDFKLISDLNNILDSTNTIVYPYIEDNIYLGGIDIQWLTKEFGFTNKQLSLNVTDTVSLKGNTYFDVIDSDSILKFRNESFCEIEKGKLIQEPFYYIIKQIYNKRNVRYFQRPIISRNRAFAIVQYDDICGSTCGFGKVLIMQQKNGQWRIIKELRIAMY